MATVTTAKPTPEPFETIDVIAEPYVTQRHAARVLGCSPYLVARLAQLHKIRIQALPGRPVRYKSVDVLRARDRLERERRG